mmetsp:Transcript_80357/g.178453  ORF Transcript_80357/g.178453 Transcript_80357/m.178453 type:complete len:123 (-) Transcript_80357:213-581(-)
MLFGSSLLAPCQFRACAPGGNHHRFVPRIQKIMLQPGQELAQVLQCKSASATFSRIFARSKGLPIPFASKNMVQQSESGQGWTIGTEYPVLFGGGALGDSFWPPVLAVMAACVIRNRFGLFK